MRETRTFFRCLLWTAVLGLAAVPAAWTEERLASVEPQIDGPAAFARLKRMAGTWRGPAAVAGGESLWVTHEIEPVVNGDVVMEKMTPSSGHEMINMYHMDGEDLILAHYCSGGHHPKMKLDRTRSSDGVFVFEFVSGSNFDPAVDKHIHDAKIVFVDEDRVNSSWTAWEHGKQLYEVTFKLVRAKS